MGKGEAPEGSKTCSRCGMLAPYSGFYSDKRAADGLAPHCKECHKKSTRDYRRRTRDKQRARSAAWRAANPDKARQYANAYVKRNRQLCTQKMREYRAANPDVYRAQTKVAKAIERGRLVRPDSCETCGNGGRIEGHHDDYSKPLEVRWLCKKCHIQADRQRDAATQEGNADD